jgi:hypothetical protein
MDAWRNSKPYQLKTLSTLPQNKTKKHHISKPINTKRPNISFKPLLSLYKPRLPIDLYIGIERIEKARQIALK